MSGVSNQQVLERIDRFQSELIPLVQKLTETTTHMGHVLEAQAQQDERITALDDRVTAHIIDDAAKHATFRSALKLAGVLGTALVTILTGVVLWFITK